MTVHRLCFFAVALMVTGSASATDHRLVPFPQKYGRNVTLRDMAFSSDGQKLAVATSDGYLLLFRTKDAEVEQSREAAPFSLAWSRDDARLLLMLESGAELVDPSNLRTTASVWPFDEADDADDSQPRDENMVWFQADGQLHLCSAGTGRVAASFQPGRVESAGQYAISPDGKRLALLARVKQGRGSGIEIFDRTERETAFIPFPVSSWFAMAFSNDSTQLHVGTRETVETVEIESRQYLTRI